ncbi:MAG: hypothetical protein JXA83_13315 [Acidimicrobiales bacterium]|nr:hypothetical protein [Acidimicrobiales bacterium]
MTRIVKPVVAVAVVAAVAGFVTLMVMVAYPGAFTWTAPVLCPADQPDPYVVRYTTQTRDGAGTNFTLFCMGDHGDFTEVGTWQPLGVLAAGVGAALLALVTALAVLAWLSRRHRPPDSPTGSPFDPLAASPAGAPIVDPPL